MREILERRPYRQAPPRSLVDWERGVEGRMAELFMQDVLRTFGKRWEAFCGTAA